MFPSIGWAWGAELQSEDGKRRITVEYDSLPDDWHNLEMSLRTGEALPLRHNLDWKDSPLIRPETEGVADQPSDDIQVWDPTIRRGIPLSDGEDG